MSTADFSQPKSDNSFDESLSATFKQQLENPRLISQKQEIFQHFVEYVPKIKLTEAETITRRLIKSVMPNQAESFGRAIERQVLASFRYLNHLQSLVPIGPEWFRQAIDDWHAFLYKAVAKESATTHMLPNYVLTAFSLVEDHSLALNPSTLTKLIEDILKTEGEELLNAAVRKARWRADLGKNMAGGKLDEGVWDGIDLLAVVIALMTREGLKPAVLNPQLQQCLIDYLEPISAKNLGGAAGNETYILHQLGQVLGLTVLTHTPYHHIAQAQAAPNQVERLIFEHDEPQKPFPLLNQTGSTQDARRLSFVLQLTPSLNSNGQSDDSFIIADQIFLPKLTDRAILRIPRPRADAATKWQTLRVIWPAGQDSLIPKPEPTSDDPSTLVWQAETGCWTLEIARHAERNGETVFKDFLDHDWPYLPLFQQRPRLEQDDVLTITLASTGQLQAIAAQVQVVLLGAIQMLGQTVFTPTLTQLLRVALVEQLQTLNQAGATLHLELSGVASGSTLTQLTDLCHQSGIHHISTNREELIQMTSRLDSAYFVAPRPLVPEDSFSTYWRAEQLLTNLELKTYYVHDLELDILVWHNEPQDDSVDVEQKLAQQRQAMLLAKAAVPATLIRRAGVDQSWDLTLSTQSLVALFAFANVYADYQADKFNADRNTVWEQILRKGYYYHPDRENGYSVVVAPTIFVDFDPAVSMAGAGDMGFAVQATAASFDSR